MESVPELENLIAIQEPPKSKWKRPVFWCSFVVLLLANVYYVSITWLPRWAPMFTAENVRHPTALARAVATQLERGNSDAADDAIMEVYSIWFAPRDAKGELDFIPWAEECFRNVFVRGDQWEKLAVLQICDSFSCPGCFDVITTEIPNLDSKSRKLAAGAFGRMKTTAAIPELEKFLSDPESEVRLATVGNLHWLAFSLTEARERTEILDLLRRVVKTDKDDSVRELASYYVAGFRLEYWRISSLVSPDEELLSLLKSDYESVRVKVAGNLVHAQFHGRLDAAWYPLLNQLFAQDTSAETRGNAALILILADDPKSGDKLKFIESLCDPKHAPLPLNKEKIHQGLAAHLPSGLKLSFVLQRWNPRWKPGFRRTPIGG